MNKVIFLPGVQKPQGYVVEKLEAFATELKTDLYVTSGLRVGDPGEHGKGLAADILAPGFPGGLLAFYLAAEHSNVWRGIGVYPAWRFDGKVIGGLHVDIRAGKTARWMGLGTGKGQTYVALTPENLKKHGVIA